VIVTQECDLEQDYNLRYPREGSSPENVEQHPNALQTITLVEAFDIEELKARLPESYGSLERRMAKKNQHERYHCLEEGHPPGVDPIPGLVLDLRTPFALPVAALYEQINTAEAKAARAGVVPDLHSHDLIHRFYSYQSRIAVPRASEIPLLEAETQSGWSPAAPAAAPPEG
jgi:hypothetical protein